MAEHPLKTVRDLDPELSDLMEKSRSLAMDEGNMPRKYKFLIAMALDASAGASDGVASLANQAMKAGATKEEIAETLRVAQFICGVGAIYTASRGLKGLV